VKGRNLAATDSRGSLRWPKQIAPVVRHSVPRSVFSRGFDLQLTCERANWQEAVLYDGSRRQRTAHAEAAWKMRTISPFRQFTLV